MAKRKDGLAKFRASVKAIQRTTGKSYRAAQQQASKEFKTVTPMKRTTHKRKRAKARPRISKARMTRASRSSRTPRAKKHTIKQQMVNIRGKLAVQLGKYEERRIASTTRKAYNHAVKKIHEIKSQIKRLC